MSTHVSSGGTKYHKPPQTTTNHRKPPQTTANHHKPLSNHHKPLQITHNSYKTVVNQIFKHKLRMIKVFWGNLSRDQNEFYIFSPSKIPYVM